jgi:g-D-glutamyl-meso-diaminopimelate peptidase
MRGNKMIQRQKRRKRNYFACMLVISMLLFFVRPYGNTVLAAEVTDSTNDTQTNIVESNITENNITETNLSEENSNTSTNETIDFKEVEIDLGVGESFNLTSLIVTNEPLANTSYEVTDNTIATVEENGTITATKIGTTKVIASLTNGNKAQCTITVKEAPNGIRVSTLVKTLKTGSSYSINPKLTTGYTNTGFTYETSNSDIAVVDKEGKVTAMKEGTVKITIKTYNNIKKVIQIRVVNKIATFKLQYILDNSIFLAKGQTRSLYYDVSPSNQKSYVKTQIIWESSNPNIVSVSKDGKITAKKTGNTEISIKTKDGSAKKLAIKVMVAARKSGTGYIEDNMSIVDSSNATYTYSEMVNDLNALEKKYGDIIQVDTLSKTYDSRNIYEVVLGNPNAKEKVMIQSSIHAREYMTSQLTMKQIEFYCKNYYSGRLNGIYFNEIFDDVAFYIIPMANPDGVTISQYGPSGIQNSDLRQRVISIAKRNGGGSSYYRTWKANARGVDLNRNFDQYWEILQGNASGRSAYGYKGPSALSEIESKTLVNLFRRIEPTATISYHSTGSIIFWDYGQKGAQRQESTRLVNTARSLTSYSLVKGFSKYHATGFSDWVSIKQRTPAITIEVGTGACPLKSWEFKSIWSKNKLVFIKTAELYR